MDYSGNHNLHTCGYRTRDNKKAPLSQSFSALPVRLSWVFRYGANSVFVTQIPEGERNLLADGGSELAQIVF